MAAHAKLGPSGAHRWLRCPGSVKLEENQPNTSSSAAEMGTLCHWIGEQCLLWNLEAEDFQGHPDLTSLTHREFSWVQEYVDYVHAQELDFYLVEQRVRITEDCWGTSDVIGFRGNSIHIIDAKFGSGLEVSADKNEQLRIYGFGSLDEMNHIYGPFEWVVMHIAQPPLDNFSKDVISVENLEFWVKEVLSPGIAATKDPKPLLVPGEKQCRFCKAKSFCKARADSNLDIAMNEFGSPTPPPAVLSPEDIARLLPILPEIKRWAEEVQGHALEQSVKGVKVPGFKVVEGRSVRRWENEDLVIEALRSEGLQDDDIYKKKLIGIGDAEKLVGKKHAVFQFAVRPSGAPTLVHESDERQEWDRSADGDFN